MSMEAVGTYGPLEMTLAAWAQLSEDEGGELVDGRLVEEEMPDAIHELILVWLLFTLRGWMAPRGGFVFASEIRLAVSPRRGRKADALVYFPGSKKPPLRGLVRMPPDIIIEIVSASPRDHRRDRVEKTAEYAAFGVKWYWLIDPEARTVEILELGADGRYIHALGTSTGTLESVPGCEGLRLDLDAMWQEVDALGSDE